MKYLKLYEYFNNDFDDDFGYLNRDNNDECDWSNEYDWNEELIGYASSGNLFWVKKCIENGADVHYKDNLTIKYAAINQKEDVVEYLLKNGNNKSDISKEKLQPILDEKKKKILKQILGSKD